MTLSRTESSVANKRLSILFDDNRISQIEVEMHKDLIQTIVSGSLRYPQVKKLLGVHYQSNSVYRAKIDKKNRLIFTYVPFEGETSLLILAVNNHNYNQLKRHLISTSRSHLQTLNIEPQNQDLPTVANAKESISFLPSIAYKQTTLVLDEEQQKARLKSTPLLLSGPPGAGKTVMLYHIMLRNLHLVDTVNNSSNRLTSPILFISQSEHLIKTVQALYQTTAYYQTHPVEFTTWKNLLQSDNATKKPIDEKLFIQWLKDNNIQGSSKVLHYELSLIASLGANRYQALRKRQCYYSDNKKQQSLLIAALERWQNYLSTNQLFDPMVTALTTTTNQSFAAVYIDEAQNLPPVALNSLMKWAPHKHITACLDSEQGLLSSPYIHNCLKELFHLHYKGYNEHFLSKTRRCRPEIMQVANHLMDAKYQLDGGEKRRQYQHITSTRQAGGLVTWSTEQHLDILQSYGKLAGTVVISEPLSDNERLYINDRLKTNNILTPEEAIGLEFDHVILWNPFSQKECLTLLAKNNTTLTLEQWNALNALYVAISRAQENVFLFDKNYNRWKALAEKLLGTLPINQRTTQALATNPQEEQQKWWQQIDYHLSEGRIEQARNLMHFHLQLSPREMDDKIKARCSQPVTTSNSSLLTTTTTIPAPNPIKPTTKTNQQITQQTSVIKPPINSQAISTKATTTRSSIENWITILLANPSEANLKKIFDSPRALEILFFLHNGRPVLTQLVCSNSTTSALIVDLTFKYLSSLPEDHPKSACSEFSPDYLFKPTHPIFYFFTCVTSGIDLVNYLFRHNTKLVKEITAEILCDAPASVPRDASELTPFYSLSKVSVGRTLLKYLFEQNPKLTQTITAKKLYEIRSKSAGKVAYTSPFYFLSGTPHGREILSHLFENNPKLIQGMTVENLCLALGKETGAYYNVSPLLYCTMTPEGLAILRCLFEKNPKLIQGITAKNLCLATNELAEEKAYTSPLYWLSANSSGIEILNDLFTQNPKLVQGITTKSLCLARAKESGPFANTSALFWFSCTPRGRTLLTYLFKQNPKLVQEISAESLSLTCTKIGGESAFTSPLYWLAGNTEGATLLKYLFERNPKLAQGITAKSLYLTIEAGEHASTSPFYCFATHDGGRATLKYLFAGNAKLVHEITAENLCQPRDPLAKTHANISPLYYLTASLDGLAILKYLFENNPRLIQGITAKSLCLACKNETGEIAPLLWLALRIEGQILLKLLFKKNPQLIDEISVNDLCHVINEEGSVLTNLLFFEPGRDVLKLLSSNANLARVIANSYLSPSHASQEGFFAFTNTIVPSSDENRSQIQQDADANGPV